MRICVAVSGGVDSLFALWSLKEQGYDVIALHGKFLPKENSLDNGLEVLKKHCNNWSIPFYIEDMQEEFHKKVIEPFFFAHKDLLTPNPCVQCNREIKFGILLERAQNLGASHLATGHYVNKIDSEFGNILQVAEDITKDQSYFLALVEKSKLQKAIFPLANKKKDEIRNILARENIEIPQPKESQEICFIQNNKHTEFIEDMAKNLQIPFPQRGKVKLCGDEDDKAEFSKKKHMHKGLWHYTEGQRKGLGIAWKKPLYVIKRDKKNNTLYVGAEEFLQQGECFAHHANFFVPYEHWYEHYGSEIYVKTRFRQAMIRADVEYIKENNSFHVKFHKKENAVAAGQTLAIYNNNNMLLAGAILF